ncbi:ImmA/IrrE family metallo-endopeptidase [Brevundimonas aveniformis]|uniref:ImmA/IrrE family metallo-endopeptidase n=1 Tax=Brevundimonas aveniformis TaxID=370977 RepID=UPI000551C95E|nr:ImmA/IrrE family metallo-endopeptidase [Brevundimonas aveniformis]
MAGYVPARVRYSRIDAIVRDLLDDHDVVGPAVPVDGIARALGLEIKEGKLGDVSGMLVRTDAGAVIGVNSKHSEGRKRFTIAHELAHFLLHTGLLTHVDRDFRVNYRNEESSQATNVEEIEANYFAASLLMPFDFLEMLDAEDAVADDEEAAALARTFGVSQHAMSLRLANVYGRYKPF